LFWDHPSFTAAAVLTLALGLGVNIAVFVIFHAALLSSLEVQRPSELMRIVTWTPDGGNHFDFSYPLYRDLRDRAEAFAGVSAYTATPVGVAVGPLSERVIGEFVTANYFSVLGVDLPVGPGFAADDERGTSGPLVIISDRLRRSMFTSGGDRQCASGKRAPRDGCRRRPLDICRVRPRAARRRVADRQSILVAGRGTR